MSVYSFTVKITKKSQDIPAWTNLYRPSQEYLKEYEIEIKGLSNPAPDDEIFVRVFTEYSEGIEISQTTFYDSHNENHLKSFCAKLQSPTSALHEFYDFYTKHTEYDVEISEVGLRGEIAPHTDAIPAGEQYNNI